MKNTPLISALFAELSQFQNAGFADKTQAPDQTGGALSPMAQRIAPPPVDVSVSREENLLGEALNVLHGTISNLEERIHGVLTPQGPENPNGAPVCGESPLPIPPAPLTGSLMHQVQVARAAVQRLNDLINRVQL